MNELARLAARAEIADVVQDFSLAVDLLDIPAVLRCVTEDVVADYGPDAAFKARGRAELAEFLNRYWRFGRTHHQLGNPRVWIDGPDQARSVTQVAAWQEFDDGSEAFAYAQFHDMHRRLSSGWKLAQRRVVMTGNSDGYKGNLHRLARTPRPSDWALGEA